MRTGLKGVALAAVALAACGGRATEPSGDAAAQQVVQAGGTVRLKVGETVRIAGTSLTLSVRSVTDSRCPIDALCVWVGDAEVRLDAAGPGPQAQTVTLHTSVEPRTAQMGGFTVRLAEVSPAPVSTRQTEQSEYVVTLEVRR